MKSTKKIFVVAIAALMLFAFTACNNTVPSVYNGVVSAEVQQVKGYFNGEEVAEDGFQIVVNYAEGEPRIIKGNKGTIKLGDNIASAAAGIEFKDFQQNPVVVVPTEVEYSVATSVTISGVEAYTVEEGWTPAAFDAALATGIPEELKNLAFTLSSGDFSSTYTIQNKVDDKEFDYQLYLYDEDGKLLGHSDEAEEGDVYTVTLHAYMINNVWTTLPEDLDTGMTISVGPKTETEVTGIEVRYSVNSGKAVTKLPTLYVGDTVEVQVFELYNNDKAAAATSAEISFVNMTAGEAPGAGGASFDVATASNTVKTTAAGTVRVTIEGADEEETIYQAPFSIGAGENWYTVTGLTAAYADEATAVKPGHIFGANNVTPAVTWGDSDAEGKTSITYTFDETSVPSDYKGTTFSTLCTARWTEKGDVKTLTVALEYAVGTGE